MPLRSTENVAYPEYQAINQLVKAHEELHGSGLRAVVLFGSLVESGESYDINLLEVVDGWSGVRRATFASTQSLPLRGHLRLYFLRPEEFEHPSAQPLGGEAWSSADLLTEVRRAYSVLREQPQNYAQTQLTSLEDTPRALGDDARSDDPISFLRQQLAVVP